MSVIATREAASRLGVSVRQVQHLVVEGALTSPARGVIDAESLELLAARRAGLRGRPWSSATAWAAVEVLTGMPKTLLGASQESRLRKRLRTMSPETLVAAARLRAVVLGYQAHPAALARLSKDTDVVVVDLSDAALTSSNRVDGYATSEKVDALVRRYALARAALGHVTLRATAHPLDRIRVVADSQVLTALHLAESLDPRERRAGLERLEIALETFNDNHS